MSSSYTLLTGSPEPYALLYQLLLYPLNSRHLPLTNVLHIEAPQSFRLNSDSRAPLASPDESPNIIHIGPASIIVAAYLLAGVALSLFLYAFHLQALSLATGLPPPKSNLRGLWKYAKFNFVRQLVHGVLARMLPGVWAQVAVAVVLARWAQDVTRYCVWRERATGWAETKGTIGFVVAAVLVEEWGRGLVGTVAAVALWVVLVRAQVGVVGDADAAPIVRGAAKTLIVGILIVASLLGVVETVVRVWVVPVPGTG